MGLVRFIATLALTMAATVGVKDIISLDDIDPISVAYNTAFEDLPLPTEALALFNDESSSVVQLEWLEGEYNGTISDTYTLFADVVLTDNITNHLNIQASIDVTVAIHEQSIFFTGSESETVNFGTAADVQFAHTDPLAISFWFKWPDNPVSTNDVMLTTFNTSSENRGFEFQMRTTGHVFFEMRNTTSTNFYTIETTADFADNQWHHLLVSKGTTVASTNIWIDGVDVAASTSNSLSATISTTDPMLLGSRPSGNFSDGYIDRIGIWNSNQTANVNLLFNAQDLNDLTEPPLHYWEFDGSSYSDTGASSSKLTGTPTNSPTFSTDIPPNVGEESFKWRIQEGDKDVISEESGFFVWGGNVIEHEGTYYMVGNKWADTDGFNGWVHYNRIYVGSSSNELGPFSLSTEISSLRTQAWAADMTTNPNIIKIGDTFYLYYVGTNYTSVTYPVVSSDARNNQRIGVASAPHPLGPWTPSENNPILSPSVSDWDQNLVNNPSAYVDGNGDINLVYKSDLNGTPNDLRLGKVKLTTWEGPVTDRSTSSPNFGLNVAAEDPIIWFEGGKYWAIFKAMDNSVVPFGNGLLAVSDDNGESFRLALGKHAYNLTIDWDDESFNNYAKIERPFVLVQGGVATSFFAAVLRPDNTSFNVGRYLTAP